MKTGGGWGDVIRACVRVLQGNISSRMLVIARERFILRIWFM